VVKRNSAEGAKAKVKGLALASSFQDSPSGSPEEDKITPQNLSKFFPKAIKAPTSFCEEMKIIRVLSHGLFDQSHPPKGDVDDMPDSSPRVYCGCGHENRTENTVCPECKKANAPKEKIGYLYIKESDGQLVRYWFHLLNKELYCILN
jgi:hypothetical protein